MTSDAVNIGPRERRKRRLLGLVALTVGVATGFVLVVYGAPRMSRAVIFFPIWIAGLGLLQSRDKTCISLAARARRNMDTGEESVSDPKLIEQLRDKARRITRRATITALAITVLALVFP